MALALDELKDTDDSYENDGISYLIDKDLLVRLGEVKVDYVEEGWQTGFMVSSSKPLVTDQSACGSSCSC